MTPPSPPARRTPLDLADVVDRVVDVGAVVSADAVVGVADVPLIRLALRLVIASAERFEDGATALASTDGAPPTVPVNTGWRRPGCADAGGGGAVATPAPPPDPCADASTGPRGAPTARGQHRRSGAEGPERDVATARGLAQLVLTVVELLREVLERQAVRRAEGDSLTDEQVERLGDTLLALDERMDELVEIFDLDRDDLRLELDLFE